MSMNLSGGQNPNRPSLLSAGDKGMTKEKLDELLEEFEQGTPLESLYTFVMNAAYTARTHKAAKGIDDILRKADNAVSNKYNPEDCELLDENAIYVGLTNLKVRAFRSWVSDILLNSEDKPWTIKPSPLPDLPEDIEDVVIDRMIEELQGEGFEGTIVDRLTTLKRIAKIHVDRVSKEAASKMEDTIHDQLTEGGWRQAFDGFIDDLGTYPAAIIKGPVVEYVARPRWNGSKVEVKMEPTYRVRRVSPYDFFPSPDSTNAHDGLYLVLRERMTRQQLLGAVNIPGFSEPAIRNMVAEHPTGWAWSDSGVTDAGIGDGSTPSETDTSGMSMTNAEDTGGLYHVVVYYGKVTGELLEEHGLKGLDIQDTYEAEVWCSGKHVIRAVLNPYIAGKRPFYVTSFDKRIGSIWGNGLPHLLHDVQRVANAAARSLVKNMAFASGPIGEYDAGRLSMEEGIAEMQPFRMYAVDSDPITPSNMPAFRFHNVPTHTRELMGVYDRFIREADDISGVPAYVLGNPDVAGAGRTLGGLSLLMGNAAKGIKKVISQVDKDVIEPLIEAYTLMNLQYNPDETIKFDTNVVARGSVGLLQRELSQARAVEVLQTLVPFVQTGDVPREGLQIVLRDVIRGLGYSVDEVIPDPNRKSIIDQYLKSGVVQGGIPGLPAQGVPTAPAPTGGGASNMAGGLPTLDNRSAPALSAIAAAQGPTSIGA